jgi:hypothetical protein
MIGQSQHRLIAEIDAGPVGNVVEHDRMRGALRERAEVKLQSALRRPRIIGAGNQISIDRPRRGSVQRVQQCACVAAGQAEADRKIPGPADFVPDRGHKPLGFPGLEGEAFAGGGCKNQSIDGQGSVVPHQRPQRRLIERSIPKRRDERQPEAMQGSSKIGSSKIASSKVSHWSVSLRF